MSVVLLSYHTATAMGHTQNIFFTMNFDLLFLANLLEADPGLIFWTTIVFLILWFFLGRTAWKPITSALRSREEKIDNALKEAEKAREEMANLKADHERLISEAKEERSRIIKEAKEIKDGIVNEAKDKAKEESAKILADAQEAIKNEKMAAITEVKNLMGNNAITLAEQVLKRELKDKSEQEAFIEAEVKRISLN